MRELTNTEVEAVTGGSPIIVELSASPIIVELAASPIIVEL